MPESSADLKHQRRAFQIFSAILALLVVPAIVTLRTVDSPGLLVPTSENPTPLGYTISLLLFAVPLFFLGLWFLRNPNIQFARTSFWRTLAVLVPGGIVLDIFFGTTFFTFENRHAVLGIFVPVVGGTVPVEEFIFYITGFALTLLLYLWCDEYWLKAYNIPSYPETVTGIRRIVRFHPASLVVGIILLGTAVIYKKFISPSPEGFPWYFTYLVLVAIIPSAGFFETAKAYINWRAFGFTFFPILLISLLWEATLAIPYHWWGYNGEVLIGIRIGAWSQLPLEAVCVWFAVTFTTVITYEVIKVWQAMKVPARQAFFGVRHTR